MKKTILLLIILFTIHIPLSAQSSGTISGKVNDLATGEPLIGASIQIIGSTLGSSTDIEGHYTIKKLMPGKYKLRASFVSYDALILDSVQVSAGNTTVLNISLRAKSLQLEQVVITGKAAQGYEAALLNQQKKSVSITDGLSAEQMKRTTDANMADALRRIPGVTLTDNKFVNLRGLSERYGGAQLNNATLASTEPEKRSFAFDLIPAALIENTIVSKSYSAENPADFGSGLISLSTADFPEKRMLQLSLGSAFIDGVTSRDIKTYSGGKLDYLGIDDGTRDLPGDFPADMETIIDPAQIFSNAKKLSNKWKTYNQKAPVNQSISIAYGDKFNVFDQDFGAVLSFNYRRNFNSNEITRKELMKETTNGRYNERFSYEGRQYSESVLWGGIANFSYKLQDFHKISLKNSYTVNADDEVADMKGYQNDQSSYRRNVGMRFVSRTLLANQLSGELFVPELNSLQMQYLVSFSESDRSEPDYRRYAYELNPETDTSLYMILGGTATPQLAGRYYSNLYEKSRGVNVNFKLPVAFAKLKMGFSYTDKARNFGSRLLGIISQGNTRESLKRYAIDSIFAEKNFRANSGFSISEYTNGTNRYQAFEYIRAGYLVLETPFQIFTNEFQLSLGLRYESVGTLLSSFRNDNKYIPFTIKKQDMRAFPSANLVYRINEEQNVKVSYSRTVNRPEFRETAPFTYYDFQNQISVTGDTTLGNASISHIDIRYEIFPKPEELFSVSVFYKEIKNAIESIIIAGSNAERSFKNAPLAKNVGFELEFRYKLSSISNLLEGFAFVGNYSRVKSEIKESRIDDNGLKRPFLRALQGQAPYIVNLSLMYNKPEWGSSFAVSYYKTGKRLIETADPNDQRSISDIYEEPRPIIDLVASQILTSMIELKLSVKDMFPVKQEYTMLDYSLRTTARHTQYSLSASFKF